MYQPKTLPDFVVVSDLATFLLLQRERAERQRAEADRLEREKTDRAERDRAQAEKREAKARAAERRVKVVWAEVGGGSSSGRRDRLSSGPREIAAIMVPSSSDASAEAAAIAAVQQATATTAAAAPAASIASKGGSYQALSPQGVTTPALSSPAMVAGTGLNDSPASLMFTGAEHYQTTPQHVTEHYGALPGALPHVSAHPMQQQHLRTGSLDILGDASAKLNRDVLELLDMDANHQHTAAAATLPGIQQYQYQQQQQQQYQQQYQQQLHPANLMLYASSASPSHGGSYGNLQDTLSPQHHHYHHNHHHAATTAQSHSLSGVQGMRDTFSHSTGLLFSSEHHSHDALCSPQGAAGARRMSAGTPPPVRSGATTPRFSYVDLGGASWGVEGTNRISADPAAVLPRSSSLEAAADMVGGSGGGGAVPHHAAATAGLTAALFAGCGGGSEVWHNALGLGSAGGSLAAVSSSGPSLNPSPLKAGSLPGLSATAGVAAHSAQSLWQPSLVTQAMAGPHSMTSAMAGSNSVAVASQPDGLMAVSHLSDITGSAMRSSMEPFTSSALHTSGADWGMMGSTAPAATVGMAPGSLLVPATHSAAPLTHPQSIRGLFAPARYGADAGVHVAGGLPVPAAQQPASSLSAHAAAASHSSQGLSAAPALGSSQMQCQGNVGLGAYNSFAFGAPGSSAFSNNLGVVKQASGGYSGMMAAAAAPGSLQAAGCGVGGPVGPSDCIMDCRVDSNMFCYTDDTQGLHRGSKLSVEAAQGVAHVTQTPMYESAGSVRSSTDGLSRYASSGMPVLPDDLSFSPPS